MEINKVATEDALVKINLPKINGKLWRRELTKWAKEKGFVPIGKGGFGLVFYSKAKPDIVIKVFSDKSYKFWYKIAKDNQSNPFVVKFKGKPVKIAEGLLAVRVEKLSPLPDSYGKQILGINNWVRHYAKEGYGIPLTGPVISYSELDKIKNKYIDDNMEELFMDILWNLSKGENSLKYTLDLRMSNFMLRGSQLVLIDPLSPIGELGRKKLNISRSFTKEDASAGRAFVDYKSIDIFNMFPTETEVVEAASTLKQEKRKQLVSDRNIKKVVIGSKDGPEFTAFYCENSRMFLPSFNIKE